MKNYVLPELQYGRSASETHCSPFLLELHHGKRLAAYVAGAITTTEVAATRPAGSRAVAESDAVVAGIYNSHTEAEAGIEELRRSGVDMRTLSIVGKDYHTEEQVVGYDNNGDRMQVWGSLGTFRGGHAELMFGSAMFLIEGIGPLIVIGPLVGWIVGALESTAVGGGLSALGAGMYAIGIPKDSIVRYETALRLDKLLLIACGMAENAAGVKSIFETTGAADVAAHPEESAT
ncbi:MAG: permease [Thermoanaerobaculia bacterium]